MANSFQIDLTGRIQNSMSDIGMGQMPANNVLGMDEKPVSTFKNVMSDLSNNLSQSMNAPDKLLQESMSGNSDVDIHDVMVAMAKAEMNVSIATQVTSKVIQAYDKIMQISV